MKKLAGRVLVLALILGAIVLLRSRAGQEPTVSPEPEQPEAVEAAAAAPLRVYREAALGRMTANEELGGVDLTVTDEDGAETAYTFTDVAPDSWYADAVNFAVSAGLMAGDADKRLFRPEFGVTRESFAEVLYRFADGTPAEAGGRFGDVAEEAPYYDAVYWIADEGVLSGLSPAAFGVGEYLTCEQAIAALYRLEGEPDGETTLEGYPYAAKVSDACRKAVAWAWSAGFISESDSVWYPPLTLSRAQLALLLMRCGEAGA